MIGNKCAFLFPGQGAQYPGMGKDFYDTFPIARQTFEEADDLLKRKLSSIIFGDNEVLLTETRNSQPAIFVVCMAILRVIALEFPDIKPKVCSGLSLGEYTALTAANYLSFEDGIKLVANRCAFMNDDCVAYPGTMAVILGLSAGVVEEMVRELQLPNDLWAANFNCPGQVVISGTAHGIAKGIEAAKAKGARRTLPLQVHGAFHSGLMKKAGKRLVEYIEATAFKESSINVVMNVTGTSAKGIADIKQNLTLQVTHSVRWEQGVRYMMENGVDMYLEIGPGTALTGFNGKIGVKGPSLNVSTVADLQGLKVFYTQTA